MSRFIHTVALLFALHVPAAHADWALGGYLESLSLDKEKARSEGVEDSAMALGFVADSFEDLLMISMGVGFIFYEDTAQFAQDVEYYDGDVDSVSSDALGMMIHVDIGPRFSLGSSRSSYASLSAGISNVLFSERMISSCGNCYSQDIDIEGGPYFQAAIGTGSDRVGVALQLTQYTDPDKGLDGSFGFTVSGMF